VPRQLKNPTFLLGGPGAGKYGLVTDESSRSRYRPVSLAIIRRPTEGSDISQVTYVAGQSAERRAWMHITDFPAPGPPCKHVSPTGQCPPSSSAIRPNVRAARGFCLRSVRGPRPRVPRRVHPQVRRAKKSVQTTFQAARRNSNCRGRGSRTSRTSISARSFRSYLTPRGGTTA
jgi:hypothetical protein